VHHANHALLNAYNLIMRACTTNVLVCASHKLTITSLINHCWLLNNF